MAKKGSLTIGPNDDKTLWKFNSQREAENLPVPVDGRPATDFAHQSIPEFYCRVNPAKKSGAVKRSWIHRYKLDVLDQETGVTKKKDERPSLGDIDVVSYDDAKQRLDEAVAARRQAEVDGERKPRLTVGAAFEKYKEIETAQLQGPTIDTVKGHYTRYLAHLKSRFLDELDYDFWSAFVLQLSAGRLLVGQRTDPYGKEVPDRRGPLSAASLHGVLNTVSGLYELAHRLKGMRNVDKGWNPTVDARNHCGAPNKRTGHIKLNQLAAVWSAADVWCTSWARDMLYIYMLTGLRRSLVEELQFSEIDWAERTLSISPHKRGAKRRKRKTPANAPDLKLPLCDTVFEILRARRQWATDREGSVWYATRPVRGRATRGQGVLGPPNADPRSSWEYVETHALGGQHFMPHDLRRTFATIGANAGADILSLSLLMLHSGQTVAADAKVGAITLDYIQTPEAQDRMRTAAIVVEQFVLRKLETFWTSNTSPVEEKPLPQLLEEAVEDDDE